MDTKYSERIKHINNLNISHIDKYNIDIAINHTFFLIEDNRYQESIKLCDYYLSIPSYCDEYPFLNNKSYCLYRLKKYDQAFTTIQLINDENSKDHVVMHTKANILYAIKKYDEGLKIIDLLLSDCNDDEDSLFEYMATKATILCGMGKYEEALKCIEDSLSQHKLCKYVFELDIYHELLAIKANILVKMKSYDLGFIEYCEAIKYCKNINRADHDKYTIKIKKIGWKISTHSLFVKDFQLTIFRLLCIYMSSTNILNTFLPYEMIFEIFREMAKLYIEETINECTPNIYINYNLKLL